MASQSRIVARQARIYARLERQTKGALRAEIARASQEIIRVYALTGEVIPARGHLERLQQIYRDLSSLSIGAMSIETERQLKAAGIKLETKAEPDQISTWATEYIQGEIMRQRIVDVSETTRRDIVQGVQAGYDQGLGQAGTAQEIIRRVPEISTRRAALIARTETHGAANYGAQRQAQSTGFPMKKVWLAGEDMRTRRIPRDAFDHLNSDGQVVGLNEPFLIPRKNGGFEALQYPGDPAGSAGNVINCRCSLAHRIDIDTGEEDIFAGLD